MLFTNFTYVNRAHKCVILQSPSGNTVYCLYPVYHVLTHDPRRKFTIVTKINPKNGLSYNFIKLL